MTAELLSRRRLLAATATGVASAVAGCGYQPGGGEFDWRVAFGNRPPFGGSTDETWRTDGTSLFRIRNRSGRVVRNDGAELGFEDVDGARVTAYRSTGETAWSGSAERPYVGDPAVDDGRVFLSLADGGVAALGGGDDEATEDGRDPTDRDEDEPDPRWTTDWAGPPLSLHAGSGIVIGVHEDGLVGLDADDGAERFALERASLAADAVVDVALAPDRLWVLGDGETGADEGEDGTSEATLYGLAADGTVETMRSLPAGASWVESVGSDALVGTADEIRAITPDGDRRFAVPTAESARHGTPLTVTGADRCYYYSRGTLEAIDVAAGEVVWRHDDSFRWSPVADSDGVYGWTSGSDRGRCDLMAVTSAGERWWTAPPLEDLGCATDLFLVDDRLVVVSEEALYGFRKAPGERLSVL